MAGYGFAWKQAVLGLAETIDAVVTRRLVRPLVQRRRVHDPSSGEVIALMFHRLFTADELTRTDACYPHEQVTAEQFDAVVGRLQDRGYAFLTPSDLLEDRHLGRTSVMLTFDDAYPDKLRALPILERRRVPAAFFITPGVIAERRRFWADALYIEGRRRGWTGRRLREAAGRLKVLPHDEVQRTLADWFGARALCPSGELDRPMRLEELKRLAASPWVEIGNHGHDHVTLAPRPAALVAGQLERAQDFLAEHTGRQPIAVAYPNGLHSDRLVEQVRRLGFRVGLTTRARPNRLGRFDDGPAFRTLGRFTFDGRRDPARQIASLELPVSAMRAVYGLKRLKVADPPERSSNAP